MRSLFQRIAVFLSHVIDAPETAEDTRETAETLLDDVQDAINGNYVEQPESPDDRPGD